MARWAGVQKVSRPIVRYHELSQMRPTITLVEAKATAQRYHGTAVFVTTARSGVAGVAGAGGASVVVGGA